MAVFRALGQKFSGFERYLFLLHANRSEQLGDAFYHPKPAREALRTLFAPPPSTPPPSTPLAYLHVSNVTTAKRIKTASYGPENHNASQRRALPHPQQFRGNIQSSSRLVSFMNTYLSHKSRSMK